MTYSKHMPTPHELGYRDNILDLAKYLKTLGPKDLGKGFYALQYVKDKKSPDTPQNFLGYAVQFFGLKKEHKGKSVYDYLQEKTGMSLEEISDLINLRYASTIAEHLNKYFV